MAEPFGPTQLRRPTGRPSLPWEAPVPPAPTEKAITKGAPAAMDVTKSGHGMQDVKGRIHRRLLERLNLSNLDKLEREQVVDAIRRVTYELLTQESVPLNFEERERLVSEVLDETFGLGPLEPLIQDPEISDILVNTAQQRLRRAARPARADRRAVPERPAPAADHRPDRLGRSAGASTRPRRWWTPACPTAPASTRSSRRWRSTGPISRSAGSSATR